VHVLSIHEASAGAVNVDIANFDLKQLSVVFLMFLNRW
jgi:hypothetical protein